MRFTTLLSVYTTLAIFPLATAHAEAGDSTGPGDLCTGGQSPGTGLRGAYYEDAPTDTAPVLVRNHGQINATTALKVMNDLPVDGAKPHAARWCGWIRPIASGPHRFQSSTPSMEIRVGGELVELGESHFTIQLEAGRTYSILMELRRIEDLQNLRFRWTPPFGATYDVPTTVLYPPVDTVRPGC